MEKRPIVLIAAVADNNVIGDDNRLIWRLKSDMKHFRSLTLGRPVLMGRKTFLSIGKPLPGRETVVLTRDAGFATEGVSVAHSLDEGLEIGQRLAAAPSRKVTHPAIVPRPRSGDSPVSSMRSWRAGAPRRRASASGRSLPASGRP